MVILYSSSLFNINSSSIIHIEILNSMSNVKYIPIVLEINSFDEVVEMIAKEKNNKNLNNESIQFKIEKYKEILEQSFKFHNLKYSPFEIKSILYINCKQIKFSDKELSQIKQLSKKFNFSMIASYSNTMILQLTTHKHCNMIVNIYSQEIIKRFDFIHHFNSGLNQTIVQDCSKFSISVGLVLNELSELSKISFSKVFSSAIQNSKLCTKAKVPQLVLKMVKNEFDILNLKSFISIQKSLIKAQPFQIQQQNSYFTHFFEMQDKERKGEILGFKY